MPRIRVLARRALPVVLLILLACASSQTALLLPGGNRTAVTRPIEILFTGDVGGKLEPCG